MGSGKQGNSSETNSSDESDHHRQEQVKSEDNSPATATAAAGRRSYECTFCKRGFTNAQALGGHMNIHRKDRAKAKHVTPGGSSSSSSTSPNMNPRRVSGTEPVNYYPVFETPRNYSVYFQPSCPSPNQQINGIQGHQSYSNEQLWGENLSLRVGPNRNLEDRTEPNGEVPKEDELDLELRLGHDPY